MQTGIAGLLTCVVKVDSPLHSTLRRDRRLVGKKVSFLERVSLSARNRGAPAHSRDLLPRMSGGKASSKVRMQNPGSRNLTRQTVCLDFWQQEDQKGRCLRRDKAIDSDRGCVRNICPAAGPSRCMQKVGYQVRTSIRDFSMGLPNPRLAGPTRQRQYSAKRGRTHMKSLRRQTRALICDSYALSFLFVGLALPADMSANANLL